MEEKKKPYEAPTLTVVTFKTEMGYAASFNQVGMAFGLTFADGFGDQNTEQRTFGDSWGSDW